MEHIIYNGIPAKSQQTNGKNEKKSTNFGNTQWKETTLHTAHTTNAYIYEI